MYRYQGNTGRYVWVPDGPTQSRGQTPQQPQPSGRRRAPRTEPPPAPPHPDPSGILSGKLGDLGSILSNVFPDGFEMEDALLLLVLFLMYKETGDKDLLIIMGAMFLL